MFEAEASQRVIMQVLSLQLHWCPSGMPTFEDKAGGANPAVDSVSGDRLRCQSPRRYGGSTGSFLEHLQGGLSLKDADEDLMVSHNMSYS